MKNVTISMDEDLLQSTRIEAAKAGKSVSRYIADSLRFSLLPEDVRLERQRHLDALQRVFDGPKLDISVNGRMPSSEARNARR